MAEAYEMLESSKPHIAEKIKSWKFRQLRPWWVKDATTSTCNCVYHLRQHELRLQYRRAALKLHQNCDCDCAFCKDGGCQEHVNDSTMPHGFITMTRLCSEAETHIEAIAAKIRSVA